MLLDGVRNWFARKALPARVRRVAAASAWVADIPPPAHERPGAIWPAARIGLAEQLWGDGFVSPGGEEEVLNLARPFGLTAAASLLLLGAGPGGPPRVISDEFDAWVSGYESDPELRDLALERVRRGELGKRVQVAGWNQAVPKFRARFFHHCLALEPLRGADPAPVLAALAAALKRGGQLALVELVADAPLDPTDPNVAAWAGLERRPPVLPSEVAISVHLAGLGFDIRVVEDISRRHTVQALIGWRAAVQEMHGQKRPPPAHAALVVAEAELWFRRLDLIRAGKLRLLRWHAIAG
jgi:SAM-dependent methyltransferase